MTQPQPIMKTKFPLLLRRPLAVAAFFSASMLPGFTQTYTQTFTLQPGWNSVYLEVTPTDTLVGDVFADPAVQSVWQPKVRSSTVAFIQNQNEVPFNRAGWEVYVPTNQPASINNDLFRVSVNQPYLVNVSGGKPITVSVSGRPSLRAQPFLPNTYTLRGFALDTNSPPTFGAFFAASPAQAGQAIYQLNNATSQWQLVGTNNVMSDGAAYWVFSAGASSYAGQLSVTPSAGDGLDFGQLGAEEDLTLQNTSRNAVAAAISDLGTGNRPLAYFGVTTNRTPAWLPLPQTISVPLGAGAIRKLRFAVQRSQMTNASYATVLSVSDGQGTQYRVAVTAQLPPGITPTASIAGLFHPDTGGGSAISPTLQAGLWVGDITVNGVAETYNDPTNTTPAARPFDLRVILHVTTNGTTRFLREVIEMLQVGVTTNDSSGQPVVSQTAQPVLLTDDSLLPNFTGVTTRDGTPAGRRFSTAGFDFDPPGGTNFLIMTGSFGVGNTVGCTITLTPSTPTNPFLHRYHPDHDNLDAYYNPIPPGEPQEVYTITRQIQMTFTATDPTGAASADYGATSIGGKYSETITGLHRNPLVVSGVFHLNQIANTPPLLNVSQ